MPTKSTESPFQALEEEAYHAFREWPVWLVLRERELDAHLKAQRPVTLVPAGPAAAEQQGYSTLDHKGD